MPTEVTEDDQVTRDADGKTPMDQRVHEASSEYEDTVSSAPPPPPPLARTRTRPRSSLLLRLSSTSLCLRGAALTRARAARTPPPRTGSRLPLLRPVGGRLQCACCVAVHVDWPRLGGLERPLPERRVDRHDG